MSRRRSLVSVLLGCSAAAALMSGAAMAQDAPLIQPGAPGQASRALEGRDAARVADNRYSADDVKFMQDMIHHHGQAVEMAALIADRTNTKAIVDLGGRIVWQNRFEFQHPQEDVLAQDGLIFPAGMAPPPRRAPQPAPLCRHRRPSCRSPWSFRLRGRL